MMIQGDKQNRSLILLLCATALVVFPHLLHLPWIITGFFFLLLCWRFASISKPRLLPGKKLLSLLTMFAVALIFAENHSILGRDAGTSAFLVALGLKLMELNTQRDAYVVVFLAFFVAITQFLFSQSVFMAIYILMTCWLLVSTLISINSRSVKMPALFKLSAGLIFQSLPIMIFLFVFFPRIPTPTIGLHDENQSAVSGLSDILEPGRISQLSLSQQTAFRVTFSGEIPPSEKRYWRGPVFWHTDGKRWTLPHQQPVRHPTARFSGAPYFYSVVLEPHQQKWLFALDLPTTLPANAFLTNEFVLLSKNKVKTRRSYQLTSDADYHSGNLSEADRKRGLQLANQPSQRIRELLDTWASNNGSRPEDMVQSALDFFHNQPFVYTLTPPVLHNNPVEEFLFETQKGFCEHYSTAFAYLMRAAKIPTRVVTGYQGGEFNAIGNFIEVRQADAHAWAEVWLRDRGWVRIDPTAAVAPDRIELGIDVGRQIATGIVAFTVTESTRLVRWLKQARQLWASIDHSWNRWVLGYDAYRQDRLLDFLGINNLIKKALWLVCLFAACMIMLTVLLFYNKPAKKEKIIVLYEKFCNKLARRKLLKKPTEGASDFALRAVAELPKLQPEIDEITRVYLRLRYGKQALPGDLLKIGRLVRHFRA